MKWEYFVRRSLSLPTDNEQQDEIVEALNNTGKDGWELVSVVVGSMEGNYSGSKDGLDTPIHSREAGDAIAITAETNGSITTEASMICYYFKRPKQ